MGYWIHFLGIVTYFCGLIGPGSLSAEAFGGFDAPQVIKLGWATRSLKSGDLNGDGLKDLAVLNNDGTKIELLYRVGINEGGVAESRAITTNRWDPILEDAPYRVEGLMVGFTMFDLVIGDFNCDGRSDLAYTAREVPLTIRLQGEDGGWLEALEFDGFEALGWTNTVAVGDLNMDGALELVVLEGRAIRVFRSDDDGQIAEPEVYPITGENPFNLLVEDVTGDGRLDLVYLNNDGKQSLALRRQLPSGSFGPELRRAMDRPARSVHAMRFTSEEAGQLVAVDSRSGFLEFLKLLPQDPGGASAKPDVYPLPFGGGSNARYAFGDFDEDDDLDLVVANTEGAEITLFNYKSGRFSVAKTYPSLSLISSLSGGCFFVGGVDQLIVLSKEEKTLGLSRLNENGRLSFPADIDFGGGDPLVAEAVNFDSDGFDELVLISETGRGEHHLRILVPSDRDLRGGEWRTIFEIELPDIRRAPEQVVPIDVFGGGRLGLMLVIPRKAPILLGPGSGEELLQLVAEDSTIRESLLSGVPPSSVSVFDVDGDGANELIVGQSGFARALRFEGGRLVAVDQFNARRGDDQVDAVVPRYDEEGELDGIGLYVASRGELQSLDACEDGVFRYQRSERVGEIELVRWLDLRGPPDQGVVFAGQDRFWHFSGGAPAEAWQAIQSYETDLEGLHYSHAASGDFDRDGESEMVALDGVRNVADILDQRDGAWSSRLFWQVFEVNMHYQGRQGAKLEPRQVLVEDLDGDGVLDLAMLVHDRILIYSGNH